MKRIIVILCLVTACFAAGGVRGETTLHRDARGNHIQGVLALGTVHTLALNDTAAVRTVTSFTARVLRLCATADCYIATGDSTVTAAAGSSSLLPAGIVEYVALAGATHLAAIAAADSTATLVVTEME